MKIYDHINTESNYQDNVISLAKFLMRLKESTNNDANIKLADNAIKELTEIALYINYIEKNNMEYRLSSSWNKDELLNKLRKYINNVR